MDVSQILEAQARDEQEMASAVEEALLPMLLGETERQTRTLVDRHGAYALYAATEAVSTLVTLHLRLVDPGARVVELRSDGTVLMDGKPALPAIDVALEIARFADVPRGSEEARPLAEWVPLAARQQPNLLRSFRATDLGDTLGLTYLGASARINDPFARWARPVRPVADPKLFFWKSKLDGLFDLFYIQEPAALPAIVLAYEKAAAIADAADVPVVFGVDDRIPNTLGGELDTATEAVMFGSCWIQARPLGTGRALLLDKGMVNFVLPGWDALGYRVFPSVLSRK